MTLLERMTRGALWGAGLAVLYFSADLVGALAAIGSLYDRHLGTFVLLLASGAATVLVGAALGALLGLIPWRRPFRWRPERVALCLAVGWIGMAIAGHQVRVERVAVTPSPAELNEVARPLPVLWVVVDTLRADVTYGPGLDFPRMPNLRRFASESLVFADAESSAGWTIPASATLLTGVHTTTLDASAGSLPDWSTTIAEHLRVGGYETRAVVDNVTLERRNGFAAGFETFHQRSGFRFAFTFPAFRLLPRGWRNALRIWTRSAYQGAAGLSDAAINIVAEPRAHGDPLFLYVHYMDPHAPYYAHPELGPDPPETEDVDFYRWRDLLRADSPLRPRPAQLRRLEHRYGREATVLDRELGRLLDAWHRRFGDQALVLITSDHGEEFLDHGRLAHGLTVHREMTHVPLLMRFPPELVSPGPRIIWEPVGHLDLVPTTLDCLGLSPTSGDGPRIQGHSWLPWLQGRAPAPDKPLIASHGRHGRRTYRFRAGEWVFIETKFYDQRPEQLELYRLSADPSEQRNLVTSQAEVLAGIRKLFDPLRHHLATVHDPAQPSTTRVNEETLRALGYIQ